MGSIDRPQSWATEEALVHQATRGDGEAFTCLYDIYVDKVYRHVSYRVQGKADVEDLTQEVFIRAWRSIQRYQPSEKPFVAWLYTIAHNLVVDYYRKQGRQQQTPLDETYIGARPDPGIEEVLSLDVVRRLLAKLPGDQQQVLMLRFIEGLDYPAVAAALGKSQGAVRVIQLRALRRLRQLLEGGQEKI